MNSLRKPSRWLGLGLVIAALTLATFAAWSQRDWHRGERDKRGGVENWGRDEELPNDTFTFARIQYDSWGGRWRGRGKCRIHPCTTNDSSHDTIRFLVSCNLGKSLPTRQNSYAFRHQLV